MATWVEIDIDPANESTTGFATGLTGAGPNFTPTTTATPDGLAHQVSLSSTADIHTITVTLTGTDADDRPQTESLAAPTSNTVESTKYFKTLTRVTVSATLGANTMDVGYVDEVSSHTVLLDTYAINQVSAQVKVTGTANFDIEDTLQSPFTRPDAGAFTVATQDDVAWLNDANFTGKTSSLAGSLAIPGIRACRVVLNSYSSGAELQVWFVQSGQEE